VQVLLSSNVTVNNDLMQTSGYLVVNHWTLTVNRDVIINGGRLIMSYSDDRVKVGRDWINNAGTAGFVEGLGTVTFFGPLLVNLPAESFTNLEVDKPSSQHQVLRIQEGVSVNIGGNLTLISGCLKLMGNSILDVNGNLTIQPGGGLWLSTSMGIEPPLLRLAGHLTDLNPAQSIETGLGTIGDCHVLFDGAGDQNLQVNYGSLQFSMLTLQKSGGSVNTSCNILVIGNFNMISGSWTATSTGLGMNLYGSFYMETGASLNMPGGILTMTSWQSRQIKVLGTINIGTFNLDNDTAGTALTLSGNCSMAMVPTINLTSGILDLGAYTLQSGAALVIGTESKLVLGPNSRLEMAAGSTLSIQSGGEFFALGTASQMATVTCPDGYFAFTPGNFSYFAAQYCVFEKLNANGINMGLRVFVDPVYSFNYCVFQNSAAGGTLIRKTSIQEFTVTGAIFPTNTWGGAYNVYHSLSGGSITFIEASGGFSGANWENDPFGSIHWVSSGTIDPPQNLQISIVAGQTQLSWNPSAGATTYRVYRSSDPYLTGWGTPIHSTSSTSWTDPASSGKFFYRVTAE
ncbi:MAG: hypothetical protein U1B83_01425, partial [Candidatus Cloacimonadaceae bacterium]|nr:hypothetical protein [Candidatus Cloacimonadaceae bacterium]